eukprot:jgi/Picsp_1/6722/NSC_04063-R1_polyunsaturated fatty acid conjugated linoleic acid-producing
MDINLIRHVSDIDLLMRSGPADSPQRMCKLLLVLVQVVSIPTCVPLGFCFALESTDGYVQNPIEKERSIGEDGSMGPDDRIAIIGAGVSGLTIAHLLETRLGFSNVTVYERNSRVGGKIFSPAIDGAPVDVGAVSVDSEFAMTAAERCGIPYNKSGTLLAVIPGNDGPIFVPPLQAFEVLGLDVASELPTWLTMYPKYKYLEEAPNAFFLNHQDENLYIPFDEFTERNGIAALGEAFRQLYVLCGYGYGEKVPAIYLLKFMVRTLSPQSISNYLGSGDEGYLTFPGGAQALLECIASDLKDVRIGSKIINIMRNSGQIRINLEGSVDYVDYLIITSDLKSSLEFLVDASPEEEELFTSIIHQSYTSSLVSGAFVPSLSLDNNSSQNALRILAFVRNLVSTRKGHVVGMTSKYAHKKTLVAYQYLHGSDQTSSRVPAITESSTDPSKLLELDLDEEAGISFNTSGPRFIWGTYFPHFDSQSLLSGSYQRLGSLQGRSNTFYAGGLFNFETVHDTSRFARYLVAQMTGRNVSF